VKEGLGVKAVADRMPSAREMRDLGPSAEQIRAQERLEKERAAQAERVREQEIREAIAWHQQMEANEAQSKYQEAMRMARGAAERASLSGQHSASIMVDSGIEKSYSREHGSTSGREAARLVHRELTRLGYRVSTSTEQGNYAGDPETDDVHYYTEVYFSW
jgi:hypothetical protein